MTETDEDAAAPAEYSTPVKLVRTPRRFAGVYSSRVSRTTPNALRPSVAIKQQPVEEWWTEEDITKLKEALRL